MQLVTNHAIVVIKRQQLVNYVPSIMSLQVRDLLVVPAHLECTHLREIHLVWLVISPAVVAMEPTLPVLHALQITSRQREVVVQLVLTVLTVLRVTIPALHVIQLVMAAMEVLLCVSSVRLIMNLRLGRLVHPVLMDFTVLRETILAQFVTLHVMDVPIQQQNASYVQLISSLRGRGIPAKPVFSDISHLRAIIRVQFVMFPAMDVLEEQLPVSTVQPIMSLLELFV